MKDMWSAKWRIISTITYVHLVRIFNYIIYISFVSDTVNFSTYFYLRVRILREHVNLRNAQARCQRCAEIRFSKTMGERGRCQQLLCSLPDSAPAK